MDNITRMLKRNIHSNYKKVFLCIGTNKCIGDSLGPKVGQILYNKLKFEDVMVLGNIKENITYRNIGKNLNSIYKQIKNPYIIVIDASLSNKEYIGNVVIKNSSIVIGSSLGKEAYKIGDISIKGIVGENKENNMKNFEILNNVSKKLIEELSSNISNQIIASF